MKQLAQGGQNKLRDLIGSEKFVEVYKSVWMGLKQKRDGRKQAQKIVAAVDQNGMPSQSGAYGSQAPGTQEAEDNGDEDWQVDEVVRY